MTDLSAIQQAMMALTLRRGAGVTPVGIDLDGTNDYGSLASDLTGNADGKTFTFSVWVYFDFLGGGNHFIYISGTGFIEISYQGGTGMRIRGFNSASSLILLATFSPPPIKTWTHMLISADLTNTSNRGVYLNDEAVSVTWTTYTDDIIDFTQSNHYIGSDSAGSNLMDGRLAGVYLDYTYRDLSTASNRRLFIGADGSYVTPPTSGIISMPMDDPTAPYRNDGTGGAFTANGTIARSGRGPNQYNPAASTFDGSADYLSASLNFGTSKNITISLNVKLDSLSGTLFYIDDGGTRFNLEAPSASEFVLDSYTTGGSPVVRATFGVNPTITSKWLNISISFNSANSSERHIHVNGVSATNITWVNYSDAFVDTGGTFYVARDQSTDYLDGSLSDIWFDEAYVDLSADNPFYDTTTGKAKDLGTDGSTPTGTAPLIYLPLRGDDAGANKGTGGDFTVNSGPYTGARGPNEFWGESAEFNGTTQYLSRSSIAGLLDTDTLTGVAAFVVDNAAHTGGILTVGENIGNINDGFGIYQSTSNLVMKLDASSGTTITATGALTAGDWFVALFSTKNGNQHGYLYKNGALVFSENRTDAIGTPDITTSKNYVGRLQDEFEHDGKIGFVWFNTEYIDFSSEANRLKFFDAFGYPVDLGADGSTPTGSQPLIYMNKGFHLGTNLGSGGDFTPQNTPTDGGFVKG